MSIATAVAAGAAAAVQHQKCCSAASLGRQLSQNELTLFLPLNNDECSGILSAVLRSSFVGAAGSRGETLR
jgi:hypothetical protein